MSLRIATLAAIGLASLLLCGCITHWVVDSETRLQLDNRTPWKIASLRVVSSDSSLAAVEWVPDTLGTGKRSEVYTESFVGKFSFSLSVCDSVSGSDTLWTDHSLGQIAVNGGSVYWRVAVVKGQLVIQPK